MSSSTQALARYLVSRAQFEPHESQVGTHRTSSRCCSNITLPPTPKSSMCVSFRVYQHTRSPNAASIPHPRNSHTATIICQTLLFAQFFRSSSHPHMICASLRLLWSMVATTRGHACYQHTSHNGTRHKYLVIQSTKWKNAHVLRPHIRSQPPVVQIYVVRFRPWAFNSTYLSAERDDVKSFNVPCEGTIQVGLQKAVSAARVGNK